MSKTDSYMELGSVLEADLCATGFVPSGAPPCDPPDISKGLSKLALDELRDLFDRCIAYYDYITDEIARLEIYLRTTEKRLELVQARLTLEAAEIKKLTNAELRKAHVITNETFQTVQQDHLYFKQMLAAQDRRYRKLSKVKEDVSRELWSRTQGGNGAPAPIREESKAYVRNMFKKVADE